MAYASAMTPAREQKILSVLSRRQPDLAVIVENVDDPHNIGAILRSCDAFGVGAVHLLYTKGKPPRMSELRTKAAASALKWLSVEKWDSLPELVKELKKRKQKIAVTTLTGKAKEPAKTDLTQPIAIAIGNEHDGVSKALVKAADINLRIPMYGFVQSFNVSVATALILSEAARQRDVKGMYKERALKARERAALLKRWAT